MERYPRDDANKKDRRSVNGTKQIGSWQTSAQDFAPIYGQQMPREGRKNPDMDTANTPCSTVPKSGVSNSVSFIALI